MFLRDPGGGWPLGRQAGPPGEYHQLPPIKAAGPRPPGTTARRVSSLRQRGGAAAPPRSASRGPCFAAASAVRYLPAHGAAGQVRTRQVPRRQAHAARLRPRRVGRPGADRRPAGRRDGDLLRPRHARRGAQPWVHPGTARDAPDPPPSSRLTRGDVNGTFTSNSYTLARHLVVPAGRDEPRPGVILCHGFPIGPIDASSSAGTFPQLIDRIAHDLGYAAMTFNFRGTGTSTGDFSLQGWIDDLRTAIDHLWRETRPTQVVLVGTNTGGSIAVCVAADEPRVRAVGPLAPRADFDDWGDH